MSDNPRPYEWTETAATVRAVPRSAELSFDDAVVVELEKYNSDSGSVKDATWSSASSDATSESTVDLTEREECEPQVRLGERKDGDD